MRVIIVSQCVLHLVLNFVLTMANGEVTEKYGGKISIFETTRTSIKLRWKFDDIENAKDDLLLVMVQYRPRSIHHKMVWNTGGFFYEIVNQTEIAKLSKWTTESYLPEDLYAEEDTTQKNELILSASKSLLPGTLYDFKLKKFQKSGSTWKADITVRTRINLSETGLPLEGCFRVLASGEKQRMVRIYWPSTYLSSIYHYKLYEFRDKEGRLGTDKNELRKGTGSLDKPLTLYVPLKRLYLWFTIELSHSENSSDTYASLVIPAEETILPVPPMVTVISKRNNLQILNWESPKNIRITSYTLVLFDANPELEEPAVMDIVNLPKNRSGSVMVRTERKNLAFGISVNTDYSSSGLFIAPYIGIDTLHYAQFHYEIETLHR